MAYGTKFNLFLKVNTEKTNKEKIGILKQYSVEDMLTLLRNVEESPREFEQEIIKQIYNCLFDKGIMCI
ncbi:MAG: hypothetical protein DBY38_12620 [Clostridium cadaveris]|uniref:Uncharacterized protein n=1 Tax=Clostridium cadaveris TaxID=1529 RepID=A0A316M5J4_9CLOT|nr:MAG: hypothetical protein DBY38_12620 [Clostridium cadaveris]